MKKLGNCLVQSARFFQISIAKAAGELVITLFTQLPWPTSAVDLITFAATSCEMIR